MDKIKAKMLIAEIKGYLTAGNPVWDVDEIAEACDMAIEALKNEINCVKCEHYTERETPTGIKGVCKMDTAHREDIIYRNEVAVAIDMADGDTKMADRKDVWDLVQGIPSVNCTRILIGSDLISRQDAIEAIEKYDFNFPEYMERFVTELRDAMKEDLKDDIAALPSAETPTVSEKHQLSEETPTNAQTELISRQDALDALQSRQKEVREYSAIEYDKGIETALYIIKLLPPAEPKTMNKTNANKIYSYLKERIGDIVDDMKEFEAWFERMVWHVKECDRLAKEPKTWWIPVRERLPSDSGNYLITVADLRLGHNGEHIVTMADFYAKAKKWNSVVDVVAWMPIPPVYQGE